MCSNREPAVEVGRTTAAAAGNFENQGQVEFLTSRRAVGIAAAGGTDVDVRLTSTSSFSSNPSHVP